MFKELNKHLMWQLDRLSSIQDDELKDVIDAEAKRARAIVSVSKEIVSVGAITIKANKLALEHNVKTSAVLGVDCEED